MRGRRTSRPRDRVPDGAAAALLPRPSPCHDARQDGARGASLAEPARGVVSVTPAPRFSVVVFARESVATIGEALGSLAAQTRRDRAEVLVADASEDGTAGRIAREFPWVVHLRRPGGTMPTLKAEAIRAARGELVCILDPADAAAPDWLERIDAAMREPATTAVGGAVELVGPATAADRAAYLFEYGAFEPPLEAGPTDGDLPGNNVAYRREALVDWCADLLPGGFYKPFFHARIRARGGRLVLDPTMRVRHLTRYTWRGFGASRFHYGRCFGAMRLADARGRRRLVLAVLAPAAPPLLVVRHLRRAWGHPGNRRHLRRAAPALAGVCLLWGTGEWLGAWLGPGRSCERVY